LATTGLMEAPVYEEHIQALADAPVLGQSGEYRYLVTLARRPQRAGLQK
jgi:hypothetical protein